MEHILISIPEGAKTVRLVNVPKGSGNNHGAWGEPRFITNRYKHDPRAERTALIDVERFMLEIKDTSYVLSTRVGSPEVALQNLEAYRKNLTEIIDNSLDYSDQQLYFTYVMCVGVIEDLTGQSYAVGMSPVAK